MDCQKGEIKKTHRLHANYVACKVYMNPIFRKENKDLLGHNKDCNWEGYISPKRCGCVSS